MLVLLLACVVPDTVERSTPTYADPSIDEASVACSTADEAWTIRVTTDAWSGNGQVYLSTDGVYVERHPMYSNGAAYDGSSDSLRLNLGMVPDFRDVVAGSTTVFGCSDVALAGILQVNERDGRTVADCRAFGDTPERWAEWEPTLACALPLDDE